MPQRACTKSCAGRRRETRHADLQLNNNDVRRLGRAHYAVGQRRSHAVIILARTPSSTTAPPQETTEATACASPPPHRRKRLPRRARTKIQRRREPWVVAERFCFEGRSTLDYSIKTRGATRMYIYG